MLRALGFISSTSYTVQVVASLWQVSQEDWKFNLSMTLKQDWAEFWHAALTYKVNSLQFYSTLVFKFQHYPMFVCYFSTTQFHDLLVHNVKSLDLCMCMFSTLQLLINIYPFPYHLLMYHFILKFSIFCSTNKQCCTYYRAPGWIQTLSTQWD